MAQHQDVVDLLKQQHVRIRRLSDEVANTKGDERIGHSAVRRAITKP